jgi:hypothetical protein
MKIEFKRKYSMQNGNKVTKKNWMNVYAVAHQPCLHTHGVKAIDAVKARGEQYFERWKLVYEEADQFSKGGYIFREINHNGGINGRHATFKEAIWHAIKHNHISVFLDL